MRIFVTGASGMIGKRLVEHLLQRGDEIVALHRQPLKETPNHYTAVLGNATEAGPWLDALDPVDAVIHLAGEPIVGQRWSKAYKQKLYDSRVISTRLIAERLAKHPLRSDGSPKIMVSGSAIGYYGNTEDEELDESSPAGSDFLAEICIAWEKATVAAERAGVRVTHIRTGVVLDRSGGVIGKLITPFRWYMGGPIASGKQWVSWIHYKDMVGILMLALENASAKGPINATAPEPQKNWGFCKALGHALHRPSWLPVPWLALRILIGPGVVVVAGGQRVYPNKAEQLGYTFEFPQLETALNDLFP